MNVCRLSSALLAAFLCLAATRAAEKPHILLIVADDMGIGDLGCFGGTLEPTPRLDALAKEGTRFGQYYAASPICSPSRAGLLTGQYPARWRITSFLQERKGNRGCEQADFLDPKAPSLPRRLKSVGYRTMHVGKWHLGGGRDVTDAPLFSAYGYDEGVGTYESPEPHPDLTATNWIWSPKDKVKRWERTAFFVDKTLDFLRRNKDAPCFVNLWLDDPHTPWVPGADAPRGDTRDNLRAVLAENDRQIGRLLDGLRQLGVEQETLVLFTSDNGPLPTFGGTRAAGLRGSKLSLYEGGIRVPFLVRWPGKVPAGRVDEETVFSALDLFPTLAALAGAPLPKGVIFDGQDLSAALLRGAVTERKSPLFWEYGRNVEWFKFPKEPGARSPNVAVREGPWKLLVNADGSGAELYDLAADRAEMNNVASRHPDIARRLSEQALAWRASLPGAAAQAAATKPAASSQMARPNIVVFLADDQSQLDSTAYGSNEVRTPNMQRLAEAGMTFTHAFVASPSCAPSRAALLTGLMPARNGAEPNRAKAHAEIKKLPAYFEKLGYEVAAFGKVAHYGHGKDYGFTQARFEGFHDYRGIPAAVDFLKQRDPSRPLCLFVGTNWPHVPWPEEVDGYDPATLQVPPNHADTPETRVARASYLTAVTRADTDLGTIYDAARAHLGANTLFLMSSDHGAQWPFGKWTCYEGGIRVPLIVAWPGMVAPGSRTAAMVSWIDLFPTLLEAAGGRAPATGPGAGRIDGRSFLPVLRGERTEHRERIFTAHSGDGEMNVYPSRSVCTREWKLILNLHPEFRFTTHVDRGTSADGASYWSSWERAVQDDSRAAALVQRYRERPAEELYDLRADPFELRNLAADPQHADRVKTMHAELEAWMGEQSDQRRVFNKPVLLQPDAAAR